MLTNTVSLGTFTDDSLCSLILGVLRITMRTILTCPGSFWTSFVTVKNRPDSQIVVPQNESREQASFISNFAHQETLVGL